MASPGQDSAQLGATGSRTPRPLRHARPGCRQRSREGVEHRSGPSRDDLHPNTAGHRKMASIIEPPVFARGTCATKLVVRLAGRRTRGIVVRVSGGRAAARRSELRRGTRLVARHTSNLEAAGTRMVLRPIPGGRRIAAGRYTLAFRLAGEPAPRRVVRIAA